MQTSVFNIQDTNTDSLNQSQGAHTTPTTNVDPSQLKEKAFDTTLVPAIARVTAPARRLVGLLQITAARVSTATTVTMLGT